jgi:hypothetical protein
VVLLQLGGLFAKQLVFYGLLADLFPEPAGLNGFFCRLRLQDRSPCLNESVTPQGQRRGGHH